jgi:hypothetical protein
MGESDLFEQRMSDNDDCAILREIRGEAAA